MKISTSHKRLTTREGLFVVSDVKADDLKKLKIPYIIYHNWGNYKFLIEQKYLPKLINLVEPRYKEYWKKKLKKYKL